MTVNTNELATLLATDSKSKSPTDVGTGARWRSRTPTAQADSKAAPVRQTSQSSRRPPVAAASGFCWVSRLRLFACVANLSAVLITYADYLWAAEWVDDDVQCKSTPLAFFDFIECLRRFTYSDSMIRGSNMFWFTIVGSFAAVVYISVEHRRIQCLADALEGQLRFVGPDDVSKVHWSLGCLRLYKACVLSSFILVLGLVPCHIDRPLLHYPLAGLMFFLMAVGMLAYIMMPLDFGSSSTDKLKAWQQRRCSNMPFVRAIFAIEIGALLAGIARVAAILTASDWTNLTGRLFGIMEVSVIAAYQAWVATLAIDDAHVDVTPSLSKGMRKSAEELSRARPVILDGMLISG